MRVCLASAGAPGLGLTMAGAGFTSGRAGGGVFARGVAAGATGGGAGSGSPCTASGSRTKAGAAPVSTKLAMRVNAIDDIHAVTTADLVDEATSWTVNRDRAAELVSVLFDEMDDAVAQATAETPAVPEQLVSRIRARVDALRSGAAAGRDE